MQASTKGVSTMALVLCTAGLALAIGFFAGYLQARADVASASKEADGAQFVAGVVVSQKDEVVAERDDAIAEAAAARAQLGACQQRFAEGTALFEPAPAGIPLLHGLATLQANLPGAVGTRVGWWIPAKVEPRRYGPPAGYSYAYTDPSGQLAAGPFPVQAVGP